MADKGYKPLENFEIVKKTVNVTSNIIKPFPNKNQYAESYDFDGGYMYLPLNCGTDVAGEAVHSKNPGLYRCLLSDVLNQEENISYELIFPFDFNQVILGSKVKNNVFIGCNTTLNGILVHDTVSKESYLIDVTKYGVPNDICFDNNDYRIVYCCLNGKFETYSGNLVKINLETREITCLYGDIEGAVNHHKLITPSGINIYDDYIYVATLVNVVAVNKHDPKKWFISINGSDTNDYPFYDNVTLSLPTVRERSMEVAIFDYNQRYDYALIHNKAVLACIMYSLSCCCGTPAILDRVNIDFGAKPTHTKIKFVRMLVDSNKYEFITLSKYIPGFDKEVTQITQIEDHTYVCVNFKANGMLVFRIQ